MNLSTGLSLLIVSNLLLIDFTIGFPHIFVNRMRRDTSRTEFKICVPEQYMDSCNEMVKAEPVKGALISCVAARDRSHCLNLLQSRGADFTPADPEDMWVGDNIPDSDFEIFDQIRTKEEPNAPFRYEGVAVIHKDLPITGLKDIKGLKSCHTGVGRNVGYKIPITKLRAKGILGGLNDPALSPRENELKALSELFSKACIVGKWSPDPDINKRLKHKYSNLCALCEKPSVCDYPDNFSGYDGALRCLAQNGGQIAWTKIYYIKKFFGVPIDSNVEKPTGNMEKFAFLCPDGAKVPITFPPRCVWAARPWQGFITNKDHLKVIKQLQQKLIELNKIGEEKKAGWMEKVLTLNDKQLIVAPDNIQPVKEYLTKAQYYDVIERDYGPPKKVVRFCVGPAELEKCRELSRMAFSRNVRPQFDCIQQNTINECLKLVRDNGADIITLNADQAYLGKHHYNLKAIAAEVSSEKGGITYSVAVVRKSSKIKNFSDLKGARACMPQMNDPAGYSAPIYNLVKTGIIPAKCPHAKSLSDLFSGGMCIPGAIDADNIDESNPKNLCKLCVGDIDSGKDAEKSKCQANAKEAFYGYKGALRCLAANSGDVAFIEQDTVTKYADGNSKEKWAVGLLSSDYELLCPSGGRASLSDYMKCNLAQIPPTVVATSNAKNNNEIDEIRDAILNAAQTFSKQPYLFRLFGSYHGLNDLLFKDTALGLVAVDKDTPAMLEYEKIYQQIHNCNQSD